MLQNRGQFLSLGLRVGPSVDRDGNVTGVSVLEARSPASDAGVRVGDVLEVVACEAAWRIDSVADYRECVCDLPAAADVEVHLRRDGIRKRYSMRPRVLAEVESERRPSASQPTARSASGGPL